MESNFGIDSMFFSEKTFASHDATIDALMVYCHSKEFAIKEKRDNKAQTKDSIATIYFVCGRAGEYKNCRECLTDETRVRSTKAHLCGCSFKASFDYVLHNHEPTTDLKLLRNARHMSREQLDMINTMTVAGVIAKAPLVALQPLDKSTLLIDRDIMNARQRLQADEFQGCREIQALADEFLGEYVKHLLKQDDEGRCTHLFIMPKISGQRTAEFHSLIQMDSTYQTNRYNIPLLHIVGHANTNRTFTITVCFMRSEKIGGYQWAF